MKSLASGLLALLAAYFACAGPGELPTGQQGSGSISATTQSNAVSTSPRAVPSAHFASEAFGGLEWGATLKELVETVGPVQVRVAEAVSNPYQSLWGSVSTMSRRPRGVSRWSQCAAPTTPLRGLLRARPWNRSND